MGVFTVYNRENKGLTGLSISESIASTQLKANRGELDCDALGTILREMAQKLREKLGDSNTTYSQVMTSLHNVANFFLKQNISPFDRYGASDTAINITSRLHGIVTNHQTIYPSDKANLLEELGALHTLLKKCQPILFNYCGQGAERATFKNEDEEISCWETLKRTCGF